MRPEFSSYFDEITQHALKFSAKTNVPPAFHPNNILTRLRSCKKVDSKKGFEILMMKASELSPAKVGGTIHAIEEADVPPCTEEIVSAVKTNASPKAKGSSQGELPPGCFLCQQNHPVCKCPHAVVVKDNPVVIKAVARALNLSPRNVQNLVGHIGSSSETINMASEEFPVPEDEETEIGTDPNSVRHF